LQHGPAITVHYYRSGERRVIFTPYTAPTVSFIYSLMVPCISRAA